MRFEQLFGRNRLAAAYEQVGSSLNAEHYVSFDFLVRITDALTEESGAPEFPRKAGLDTSSPHAMGFVYYMLRTVGTPTQCYEQAIKLNPTCNRLGKFVNGSLTSNKLCLLNTSRIREPNRPPPPGSRDALKNPRAERHA